MKKHIALPTAHSTDLTSLVATAFCALPSFRQIMTFVWAFIVVRLIASLGEPVSAVDVLGSCPQPRDLFSALMVSASEPMFPAISVAGAASVTGDSATFLRFFTDGGRPIDNPGSPYSELGPALCRLYEAKGLEVAAAIRRLGMLNAQQTLSEDSPLYLELAQNITIDRGRTTPLPSFGIGNAWDHDKELNKFKFPNKTEAAKTYEFLSGLLENFLEQAITATPFHGLAWRFGDIGGGYDAQNFVSKALVSTSATGMFINPTYSRRTIGHQGQLRVFNISVNGFGFDLGPVTDNPLAGGRKNDREVLMPRGVSFSRQDSKFYRLNLNSIAVVSETYLGNSPLPDVIFELQGTATDGSKVKFPFSRKSIDKNELARVVEFLFEEQLRSTLLEVISVSAEGYV